MANSSHMGPFASSSHFLLFSSPSHSFSHSMRTRLRSEPRTLACPSARVDVQAFTLASQSCRQGWILLTQTAVSIRSGGYTQTDTMYSHCAACVRSGEAIRRFMPYLCSNCVLCVILRRQTGWPCGLGGGAKKAEVSHLTVSVLALGPPQVAPSPARSL